MHRHSVTLTAEEQNTWNEINAEYFQRRQLALQNHPELRDTPNFWDALDRLLAQRALPTEAKLIELREHSEALVQGAANKDDIVVRLLASPPPPMPPAVSF